MLAISISKELAIKVPNIVLSCIECDVQIIENNSALWTEIENKVKQLSSDLKVEEISKIPAISASRKAYKACGKDPARYRLSAEALLRRVVKRNEIYQINNVVDLLNLVSISTGFSIGGYDVHRIKGEAVFGIGEKDEPYTGIGRGDLNIEFIPVFRDKNGAFGTSTSDSQRTSVSSETTRFIMIIIDYSASSKLQEANKLAISLLGKYAGATNIQQKIIKYNEEIL